MAETSSQEIITGVVPAGSHADPIQVGFLGTTLTVLTGCPSSNETDGTLSVNVEGASEETKTYVRQLLAKEGFEVQG